MAVNWNLLQPADVAGAFQQGMEQGRQRQGFNALTAYAQNPTEQGLNDLAKYDPQFVMQQKQQMASAESQQRKEASDVLGRVAMWADTPEKWDQGMDYLSQFDPTFARHKGKFSEANRMTALAFSDKLKDSGLTEQYTLAPGSIRFDAKGNQIAAAPFAPRPVTVGEGQTVVEYAPGQPAGGFDAFHQNWLAPAEGGYVASDGRSGAPANFGINQAANPDINVANLTPEQAAQIMHDRYWVPSGADKIQDPALQAIHADTAVNMGVGASQKLLQASGGDPAKYLQLREQRYRQIGGADLPGWLNRNQKLAQYAGIGGGRVIAQGAPKTEKPAAPPAGYRWKADGTLEPIPGGPAAAKATTPQQEQAYSQSAMDAFDRAIGSADRLLKHNGLNAAVGVPSINPFDGNLAGYIVPGSPAADFRAELEAMKAQVFLPMVQSMKGMGALSNAEGEKLTASIGALDPKMSEGAFKASLNRIIGDLNTYKARATNGAPRAAAPARGQAPARKPSVSNW